MVAEDGEETQKSEKTREEVMLKCWDQHIWTSIHDSFFLSPLCQSGPKQTEDEPDWRESKGRQTVTGQSQEACGSVKVASVPKS